MKILLNLCYSLLFVVGSTLLVQIRETGTKGSNAVIYCPYAKGYEAHQKYFCKGVYPKCHAVLKSDGKEPWTFSGRVSLHDNTEQQQFVVTISAVTVEDTGTYGCGVKAAGRDLFTLVQLTVNKAPEIRKPSPTSSAKRPFHTTKDQPLLTMTAGAGSATEATGNTTQPSGPFTYGGGVLGAVLLVLAITSGMFFALRCSREKAGSDTRLSMSNSEEKVEQVHLYEEIKHHVNAPVSTSQGCVPLYNTIATNQNYDLHPACSTIYVTATTEREEPHPGNSTTTIHAPLVNTAASTSVRLVSSQGNHTPDSSRKSNYCYVSVQKDKAIHLSVADDSAYQNKSPVYQVIVA